MSPIKFINLILICSVLNANLACGYNILVIMSHPGKSHFDAFNGFFVALAEKGHNVTVLSHVPMKNTKNLRQISLRDTDPILHVIDMKYVGLTGINYYAQQLQLIKEFADTNCEKDLRTVQFQDFLKENNQFDLVLGEMFNTNCYNGLLNKYKAPFIGLTSCDLMPWHYEWFDVPFNPAYYQTLFAGFKKPLSFFSRVENFLLHLVSKGWYKLLIEGKGNELSKKYIGYEAANPRNASLIFSNSHYILNGILPLPPSVIEVGGIHINSSKSKSLPKDIEDWINNSEAGVIYFSLGSMIKSDTFSEEQRKAFIKALGQLPQRVLWKWENDTMPDKPDNVMIRKWMPQFEILSHPNVKLYVAHGGLLGTLEALYSGIPLLVMPQFGDQLHNAHAAENAGIGIVLNLQKANEKDIENALNEALDPQLYNRAKSLSEKFRDRPLSPMDTAVYWVEHVAKYKGAPHMRSPGIDLPFYQYYLLDVVLFLFAIALVAFHIFYKLLLRLVSLSYFKKSKKKLS